MSSGRCLNTSFTSEDENLVDQCFESYEEPKVPFASMHEDEADYNEDETEDYAYSSKTYSSSNSMQNICTDELVQKTLEELDRHQLSYRDFAKRVLYTNPRTFTDILDNPKPWDKLKQEKKFYVRMKKWLCKPLSERLAALEVHSRVEGPSNSSNKTNYKKLQPAPRVRLMKAPVENSRPNSEDSSSAGLFSIRCQWQAPGVKACQKVLHSMSQLSHHVRIKHIADTDNFACFWRACQRGNHTYSNAANLLNHVITHSGAKPFECLTCGKAFTHKSYLTSHERLHSGLKPHKCNLCGTRFTYGSNLRRHERLHKKEGHFSRFRRGRKKNRLDEESSSKMLSALKPYKCDLCNLRFKWSIELITHTRSHGDEAFTEDTHRKEEKRSVSSNPNEYICELERTISTKELAERIIEELDRHRIPRGEFARRVLGITPGRLPQLLSSPKTWRERRSASRQLFIRMWHWLNMPLSERMAFFDLPGNSKLDSNCPVVVASLPGASEDGSMPPKSKHSHLVKVVLPPITSTSGQVDPAQTIDENGVQAHVSDELIEQTTTTREISQRLTSELIKRGIPQQVFAERVLHKSQGTLCYLLREPKPWADLSPDVRKEPYRQMWRWLNLSVFERLAALEQGEQIMQKSVQQEEIPMESDWESSSTQDNSGTKIYQCTIKGCDKVFTRSSYLCVHMLHHRKVRLYPCNVKDCNMICSRRDLLRKHIRQHHNTTRLSKQTKAKLAKTYLGGDVGESESITLDSMETDSPIFEKHDPEDDIPILQSSLSSFAQYPDSKMEHLDDSEEELDEPEAEENPYHCSHDGCNTHFPTDSSLRKHMLQIHHLYMCKVEDCRMLYHSLDSLRKHMLYTHRGLVTYRTEVMDSENQGRRVHHCTVRSCDWQSTDLKAWRTHVKLCHMEEEEEQALDDEDEDGDEDRDFEQPPIETTEIALRISNELRRYKVPLIVFAHRILKKHASTLADLLRNPKSWRERRKRSWQSFLDMWTWLQLPEWQRRESLGLESFEPSDIITESSGMYDTPDALHQRFSEHSEYDAPHVEEDTYYQNKASSNLHLTTSQSGTTSVVVKPSPSVTTEGNGNSIITATPQTTGKPIQIKVFIPSSGSKPQTSTDSNSKSKSYIVVGANNSEIKISPNKSQALKVVSNNTSTIKNASSSGSIKLIRIQYKCNICQENFTDWAKFNFHKLNHHSSSTNVGESPLTGSPPTKPLSTTSADAPTDKQIDSSSAKPSMSHQSYKPLLQSQFTNRKHECDICNRTFSTKYKLTQHTMMYHSQLSTRRYQCNICKSHFADFTKLFEHKVLSHPEFSNDKFECDCCGKSFATLAKLSHHKRMLAQRLNSGLYSCETCGRSFPSLRGLTTHKQRNHQPDNAFKCEICNKLFSQSYNLKIHKMVHLYGTVNQCDTCGKSFTRKADLKRHKLSHTKQRQYQCTVCSESFTLLWHLHAHNRIHFGEYIHKCDLCQERFTKLELLKQHKRAVHFGDRAYICDVCNKGFNEMTSLNRHKAHSHDKIKVDMYI